MNRLLSFLVIAVVATLGHSNAAETSPDSEKTLLRFNYRAGQVFECKSTMHDTVAGKIQGRKVEFATDTEKTETWTVRSVSAAGNAVIHKKCDRYKFAQAQLLEGRELGRDEYDSASSDPAPPELAIVVPLFESMVNAEIEIEVDRRGKTLKATPLTEQQNAPPNSEGGEGTMMFVFPEEPIRPGHEWKETVEQETPVGLLSAVVTLTYEGPTERDGKTLQKICTSSKTTLPDRKDEPLKASGTILFDSESGQLVEISTETTNPSPKMLPSLKNPVQTIKERRVWALRSEGADKDKLADAQPSSEEAPSQKADEGVSDAELFEQMLAKYPEYSMEAAKTAQNIVEMLGGEVSDEMMALVRKRAAVELVLREAKIRIQVAAEKFSELEGKEPHTPLYPDESSRMAERNYNYEHNSALTMRVQAMKHVAEARELADKTLPAGDPMFDRIDAVERVISPEASRARREKTRGESTADASESTNDSDSPSVPTSPLRYDGVYRFKRPTTYINNANRDVYDYIVFRDDGYAYFIEGDYFPGTDGHYYLVQPRPDSTAFRERVVDLAGQPEHIMQWLASSKGDKPRRGTYKISNKEIRFTIVHPASMFESEYEVRHSGRPADEGLEVTMTWWIGGSRTPRNAETRLYEFVAVEDAEGASEGQEPKEELQESTSDKESKPKDDHAPDMKEADEKKADEKKTDEKKTDEKKTDEKKTDEKKTDGKKVDGKKASKDTATSGEPAGGAPESEPVDDQTLFRLVRELKRVEMSERSLMLRNAYEAAASAGLQRDWETTEPWKRPQGVNQFLRELAERHYGAVSECASAKAILEATLKEFGPRVAPAYAHHGYLDRVRTLGAGAVPHLKSAAADKDNPCRIASYLALRSLHPNSADVTMPTRDLLAVLGSTDSDQRRSLIEELGRSSERQDEVIAALIKQPTSYEAEVAEALVRLPHNSDSLNWLKSRFKFAIRDAGESRRLIAITEALIQFSGEYNEAIDLLCKYLELDPTGELARDAHRAPMQMLLDRHVYGRAETSTKATTLSKVREQIAIGLGEAGPAAESAIPDLFEMLTQATADNDDVPGVLKRNGRLPIERAAAAKALGRIGPKARSSLERARSRGITEAKLGLDILLGTADTETDLEDRTPATDMAPESAEKMVEQTPPQVSDPAAWLNKAREEAEQLEDPEELVRACVMIADACHQTEDPDGYTEAMEQAHEAALGTFEPKRAVEMWKLIIRTQTDCNDREGAVESLKEAFTMCEANEAAGQRANDGGWLAGYASRVGDTRLARNLLDMAMKAGEQSGERQSSSEEKLRPQTLYAILISKIESGEIEAAHEYWKEKGQYSLNASGYARLALAAAAAADDSPEMAKIFDAAYPAVHRAILFKYQGSASLGFWKKKVTLGDVCLGAFDRARVGLLNDPDPNNKAEVLTAIVRKRVEGEQMEEAKEALADIPPGTDCAVAIRWIAEGEQRFGTKTPRLLGEWAAKHEKGLERVMAYAGLAIGASIRGEANDNDADDAARKKSASSNPWLAKAAEMVDWVDMPRDRAALWTEIALCEARAGNAASYRYAVARAIECVVEMCEKVDEERPAPSKSYDGVYEWGWDHSWDQKSRVLVPNIMNTLFEIQEAQRLVGDEDGSHETLLLAARCSEIAPENGQHEFMISPEYRCAWEMRIAGRAARLGRDDMASVMKPFFKEPARYSGGGNFHMALYAGEARDTEKLDTAIAELDKLVARFNKDTYKYHAAQAYGYAATMAAEADDPAAVRRAAAKVSGLYKDELAAFAYQQVAAALAETGNWKQAQMLLKSAEIKGKERDRALATIVRCMAEEGDAEEARDTIREIADRPSRIHAWVSLIRAQRLETKEQLSEFLGDLESDLVSYEQAACYIGMTSLAGKTVKLETSPSPALTSETEKPEMDQPVDEPSPLPAGVPAGKADDLQKDVVAFVTAIYKRITLGLDYSAFCKQVYEGRSCDWETLAEEGDPRAQFLVGYCYDAGLGRDMDKTAAADWYRKSAEQGFAPAQGRYGYCLQEGIGVDEDLAAAVEWLKKGAEQGCIVSQHNLGNSYEKGIGVEQDGDEAVQWYNSAAERGYAPAQNSLGWCHSQGIGVAKDELQAAMWYRKAAEQEFPLACANLGYQYFYGDGVVQDYDESLLWSLKAAKQGNAVGQRLLANHYFHGYGVEQDLEEAIRWSKKAADQGDAVSQYNLGICYAKGNGVKTDKAEAFRWYRAAAEQGNPSAQHNLAHALFNGEGVEQNKAEAIDWYAKAANQGEAMSQLWLGILCYDGDGVQQDKETGLQWIRMAADQGYEDAIQVLKELGEE